MHRWTREPAIAAADLENLSRTDAFLAYLDALVTWIPTGREVVPRALLVYYVVNQASRYRLKEDEQFDAWLKRLVQAWGEFLDTPASAAGIPSTSSPAETSCAYSGRGAMRSGMATGNVIPRSDSLTTSTGTAGTGPNCEGTQLPSPTLSCDLAPTNETGPLLGTTSTSVAAP